MQDNPSLRGAVGDLFMLGRDPELPFQDLNLAGAQGVPSPDMLTRPTNQPAINAPTFTAPEMHVPALASADLHTPGVDLHPPFTPDPALPDLDAYGQPGGLSIYPASPTTIDPSTADLLLSDRPADLTMQHDLLEPDPLLPDLQHPDLTLQTQMLDRPGDLDDSALSVMHLNATYQQLGQKEYPAVQMDQSGVNSTRSRHMDLLMRGLDREER